MDPRNLTLNDQWKERSINALHILRATKEVAIFYKDDEDQPQVDYIKYNEEKDQ